MSSEAVGQLTPCNYEFVSLDQPEFLRPFLNDTSIQRRGGYRVVHFGDSHIQADRITSTIREAFQQVGGNGGSGLLFPYSLCGSFGPRGVESQVNGKYTYSTLLKNPTSVALGVMGYSLLLQQGAELTFSFNEEFKGKKSTSITIWVHSAEDTMHIQLDTTWKLVQRKSVGLGIFAYTYETNSIPSKIRITANIGTAFWGIEFNQLNGLAYQQSGLVGAQFKHLLVHEDHVMTQLLATKPDLLVFSYGTNEAYEVFDSLAYHRQISNFMKRIQTELPNTGILITNAPDTRSSGKIPESQILVNETLRSVAEQNSLAYFDLNKAMGGWGSLHSWSKKGFTLKDQLHFNKEGARILGLLISEALFTAFNLGDEKMRDTMKKEISLALCKTDQAATPDALDGRRKDQSPPVKNSETLQTPENNKPTAASDINRIYTVRNGDTLSSIARKTNTTVNNLMKKNKLGQSDIIRPGQKLKYE